MKTISYPKIETVAPLPDKRLLVRFSGGEERVYDCSPLLEQEPFSALENESFFRQVKVDAGGYGVSWSDEIDLSESELWLGGAHDS
ncbi:MAG TPA: DUF2442 domain-containing protein [Rectinemataceae bacterium]|nr:DUF2442 domain-containing protein [Rectinemataceae bacterium]